MFLYKVHAYWRIILFTDRDGRNMHECIKQTVSIHVDDVITQTLVEVHKVLDCFHILQRKAHNPDHCMSDP